VFVSNIGFLGLIKKIRELSPRANYTNRATAKLAPTFTGRGCKVVSVTDPLRQQSRFSRPEPLLSLLKSKSKLH
jgi:hypothetical protein